MRISIITLTLDSPRFIEETIGSIDTQGLFELEHIVMHDGDESFIRELGQRHPTIKILRGEGAGATVAAARAVEAAAGDFILFLHSDDRLGPKALNRLVACATTRPDTKIWTGGARIFRVLADGSEDTIRFLLTRDLTELSLKNICDDLPLLSARFCHRSVFSDIGNFDPLFSESSDREFLLRAFMAGISEAPLDVLVSEMRLHDGSRTIHRHRGRVPPYFAEHIRLADVWLACSGIEASVRRYLRNWRAREFLRLCVYQFRAGQWKAAAALLIRAEIADPFWIFRTGTTIMALRQRSRGDDLELLETGTSHLGGVERTK